MLLERPVTLHGTDTTNVFFFLQVTALTESVKTYLGETQLGTHVAVRNSPVSQAHVVERGWGLESCASSKRLGKRSMVTTTGKHFSVRASMCW